MDLAAPARALGARLAHGCAQRPRTAHGRLTWMTRTKLRRSGIARAAQKTKELVGTDGSRNGLPALDGLPKGTAPPKKTAKPRVVILGSGWGAMSMMKALTEETSDKYDVVLISPRNYFLYTPLLPAVCTGTMEDRSIVEPVRNQVRGKGRYYEALCQSIDPEREELVCCFPKDAGLDQACFKVEYDILVVAVGSINNTFGTPGVEENCYFFKTIDDAKRLRQRVSELFERAALPHTPPEERKRLLSMVIVGGGPTGVEVAAEMRDMVREDMRELYGDLVDDCRISVVELQDHILSTYDRRISEYAARQFFRSDIDLLLNTKVAGVERDFVRLVGQDGAKRELKFGVCIWCTGIKLNPLAQQLQQSLPEGSQTNFRAITTDQYLRVKGSRGSIFAIGDVATIEQPRALVKCQELFEKGDANKDGRLSLLELRNILLETSKDYPHLEEYASFLGANSDRFGGFASGFLRSRGVKQTLDGLDEKSLLTLDDFKELLGRIESNLRVLPATAQVARQQGEYLAKVLGETKLTGTDDTLAGIRPFQYNHKGQLAYVGDDRAVMDIPVIGEQAGGLGDATCRSWRGARS